MSTVCVLPAMGTLRRQGLCSHIDCEPLSQWQWMLHITGSSNKQRVPEPSMGSNVLSDVTLRCTGL